jgi:hypothetical protein
MDRIKWIDHALLLLRLLPSHVVNGYRKWGRALADVT